MGLESGFQGHREMIAMLDSAVRQPTTEEITGRLKDGMCDLIRSGVVRLPDPLRRPNPDHYARRLLYRSDDLGYVVVAMIWGPGQGTALHDHGGTWCVEGVLEGQIAVTQYDLLEQGGQGWQFRKLDTQLTGVGTAGSLIPPHEYHTIANPQTSKPAITMHVYGHEMRECRVFQPADEGWYQPCIKSLSYDN